MKETSPSIGSGDDEESIEPSEKDAISSVIALSMSLLVIFGVFFFLSHPFTQTLLEPNPRGFSLFSLFFAFFAFVALSVLPQIFSAAQQQCEKGERGEKL